MAKKISDEALLQALLEHGGVAGAAEAVGLSKNAVYKRLQNSGFRAEYAAAQGAVVTLAAAKLTDAVGGAVDVLTRIMNDEDAATGIRLSACDAVLRHCLRYCEIATLENRISELEARQAVSVFD